MNFCIFHSTDNDGQCSAAIVHKALEQVIFIPYSYQGNSYLSSNLKFNDIQEDDFVYIVDCSIPFEVMDYLKDTIKAHVVWIDHHDDVIKQSIESGHDKYEGIRDPNNSATYSVWKWFYSNGPVPQVVDLVDKYDTWKWVHEGRYHEGERYIPAYMFQCYTETTNVFMCSEEGQQFWKELLDDDDSLIQQYLQKGKVVIDYLEKRFARLRNTQLRQIMFHNVKFLAINSYETNSTVYGSIDWNEVEAVLWWYVTKQNQWVVSMRTERNDIDVSEIARKYGGNGHPVAAAFRTDQPIPEIVPGINK